MMRDLEPPSDDCIALGPKDEYGNFDPDELLANLKLAAYLADLSGDPVVVADCAGIVSVIHPQGCAVTLDNER